MINADYIRNMTNRELAELLCFCGWRLGQVAECEEWLKQPKGGAE